MVSLWAHPSEMVAAAYYIQTYTNEANALRTLIKWIANSLCSAPVRATVDLPFVFDTIENGNNRNGLTRTIESTDSMAKRVPFLH